MSKRGDKPGQLGDYWLSLRPGSANWHRTWFDAAARQTRRESLGTADFAEAEGRLAEWFVENRQPRREQPASVAIEELLVRHYKLHASGLKSAPAVEKSLGYWSSYFEGATVADVTPARVKGFAAELFAAGKSSGYVRRILADGKAALNGAWRRGEIAALPFVDLAIAPEGEPRERILTVEEMAALLDASTVPHLRVYLLLAIGTMARPEAITDLTSFAIDWGSSTINLLPQGQRQTKKRRPIVPIVRTLRPLLASLPAGHLVAFNGRPVGSVRTSFEKAVEDAGLGGSAVNRYSIRHTIISEAMKRCAEPWQVERFAAHTTGSKTTARYVKFSPGYLSKAAAAVDDYFDDVAAEMRTGLLDFTPRSALQLRSSVVKKVVEPSGIEPLTSTMPL